MRIEQLEDTIKRLSKEVKRRDKEITLLKTVNISLKILKNPKNTEKIKNNRKILSKLR